MYIMVVLIIFFFISTKSDPHNIGSLTTKRLISGHTDLEESSLSGPQSTQRRNTGARIVLLGPTAIGFTPNSLSMIEHDRLLNFTA